MEGMKYFGGLEKIFPPQTTFKNMAMKKIGKSVADWNRPGVFRVSGQLTLTTKLPTL